ncbi:hypothetical protein L198_08092 [Cryptococcus wingfieldii CBS 7118]|uniref:Glycosyl hydrolase family 88 n=1 Tax=Cryptococcus wingfieldii CBS 7118 TaxID=1295528 RepID=A0A1E3HJ96_9TREE|nr:hypothetical protein L198_08092 [Cryptococcus wingfieldii CBS 7118]ODN76408.1 hypothetical protein L198_08092 [Cryptococcus wingfieldii CBS 7118]
MLVPALLALSLALPLVSAEHLSDSLQSRVYDVMNQISTHSWENGTKAQAILEATYPAYSVFSSSAPLPLPADFSDDDIPELVDIARITMQQRPETNHSASARGGSTLLSDDAAGDPASLGITILLANASTLDAQVNGVGYSEAAEAELNYLLYDVPRTSSGAISHRADQPQLWADSAYMVPPFLAYYASLHSNLTLLRTAYDQISLYRDALQQDNMLWNHIEGGSGTTDAMDWATGNAWAMAGMLRVWATFYWSGFRDQLESQMSDLEDWIDEIFVATTPYITSNGILRNYITDNSSFEDTSASALYAAVGLRLSTLNISSTHLNTSLTLLSSASSYVNSSGFLTQTVNPLDFSHQATDSGSPEGQAFVVMAYAAHKDWDALGREGRGGDDGLGETSGALGLMRFGLGGGSVGWGMVGLAVAVGCIL